MVLMDELRKISEQVAPQRSLMKTEAATKNASVEPFIHALGYDTSNLAEVEPEYTADAKTSGSEKVDYAIKQAGKPVIFIEAKSADKVLSENHWKQLYNYYGAGDVRFGILTNGVEYRFYADLKKLNIMDKQPFLTIDMLNLDEKLVNELEGFTKSGFDPERILQSAYGLSVQKLLEKEYQNPSPEFVRYFAKQVLGSARQADIDKFRQAVGRAFQQFVNNQVKEKPTKPISGDSVEVPVFADYKGQRCQATLLLTDEIKTRQRNIRFEEEVLTPSVAGKKAMRSIHPSISGTNGWTFWKLRDPDTGKSRLIKDLRGDHELVRRLLSHYRQG